MMSSAGSGGPNILSKGGRSGARLAPSVREQAAKKLDTLLSQKTSALAATTPEAIAAAAKQPFLAAAAAASGGSKRGAKSTKGELNPDPDRLTKSIHFRWH